MFCLFCTIPAKNKNSKSGGEKRDKPSKKRSIITWSLVFTWIFLLAFGLVAASGPSWLESFAHHGHEGESRQIKQNGDLFLREKNYRMALAQYKRAIEINPENVGAIVNSAIAYNLCGDPEAARILVEKVITQNPKLIGTLYYNLAEIYAKMKKYPEALKNYEKSIGTELSPQIIYTKLIEMYKETEQIDKAYQAAEKLLEIQTDPLTPYKDMLRMNASTYAKDSSHYSFFEMQLGRELTTDDLKDYDIETIRMLNRSNHEIAKTYNYLALFCIIKDDIDKAIEYFEQSKKIWPGNEDAVQNLRILKEAKKNNNLPSINVK